MPAVNGPDLFNQREEGRALRDEALATHEERRAELLAGCRSHLARLGTTRAVSADDARDYLLQQPDAEKIMARRKDWMGALFKKSEWVAVGWTQSRYKENHARVIRTWRIKSFTE